MAADKLGNSTGNRGKGRKKGVPNKITANLKEAILEAAKLAGGAGGTVAYLHMQAIDNPGPFMALLGKVLPLQIAGDGKDGALVVEIIKRTYENSASG
jgi:hypothetical protein